MPVTEEQVRKVLKEIKDPEIHISILDLGLIYGVDIQPADGGKSKVGVKMTLTGPGCPYGPALLSKTHADVSQIPGVADVNVDLVWIPQWDPRKMASEEAKMQLGIMDDILLDDEDEEPVDGGTAAKPPSAPEPREK
jgi:metal-sulfur cluster biosynthetic enzyme